MTSNAQTWDNYYTLADTVEVGDIIDLDGVWLKVIEKKKTGIKVANGKFVSFGDVIFGWMKKGHHGL